MSTLMVLEKFANIYNIQNSYEVCKAAVLDSMFKDVFKPHQNDEMDRERNDYSVMYYVKHLQTTPVLSSDTEENKKLKTKLYCKLKEQLKVQVSFS